MMLHPCTLIAFLLPSSELPTVDTFVFFCSPPACRWQHDAAPTFIDLLFASLKFSSLGRHFSSPLSVSYADSHNLAQREQEKYLSEGVEIS